MGVLARCDCSGASAQSPYPTLAVAEDAGPGPGQGKRLVLIALELSEGLSVTIWEMGRRFQSSSYSPDRTASETGPAAHPCAQRPWGDPRGEAHPPVCGQGVG